MAAGGMSNQLMYVARVLRDQLDDLLEGTAEAPRLRSTLEFAAQHILVSRDAPSNNVVGSRRKGKERATTNAGRFYGSSSSEELLNPRLWSTLPSKLVIRIFAHLSLPKMKLLRLLSKNWKRRIDSEDSFLRNYYRDNTDFRQVWDEACTSKFALICPEQIMDDGVPRWYRQGKFWVNAFDLRTNKWYSALYKADPSWHNLTVCACDGGLICFMYKVEDEMMGIMRQFIYRPTRGTRQDIVRFVVWNPATGDEVEVPLLRLDVEDDENDENHDYDSDDEFNDENHEYDSDDSCLPQSKFHRLHTHPEAVKLLVDRESKHYKLMVVNSRGKRGNYEVSVYEGGSSGWTIQENFPDNVSGYTQRCALKPLERIPTGAWLYEFPKQTLRHLKFPKGEHISGRRTIIAVNSVVTGDQVFLLYRIVGMQVYQIVEYFYEAGKFREVKVQSCSPLDNLPQVDQYTLRLHSCQGFLMVSAYPKSFSSSHQRHWFCDLRTGRWRRLPPLAEDKKFKVDDVMCELQWNIVPRKIYMMLGDGRKVLIR